MSAIAGELSAVVQRPGDAAKRFGVAVGDQRQGRQAASEGGDHAVAAAGGSGLLVVGGLDIGGVGRVGLWPPTPCAPRRCAAAYLDLDAANLASGRISVRTSWASQSAAKLAKRSTAGQRRHRLWLAAPPCLDHYRWQGRRRRPPRCLPAQPLTMCSGVGSGRRMEWAGVPWLVQAELATAWELDRRE